MRPEMPVCVPGRKRPYVVPAGGALLWSRLKAPRMRSRLEVPLYGQGKGCPYDRPMSVVQAVGASMWFRLEESLCGPGQRHFQSPIRPEAPVCGPCRRRPHVVQAEGVPIWSRLEVPQYSSEWRCPYVVLAR